MAESCFTKYEEIEAVNGEFMNVVTRNARMLGDAFKNQ